MPRNTITFPLKLSAASTQLVTADYNTADETATAGVDYMSAVGTAVFPPGTTEFDVVVRVRDDPTALVAKAFKLLVSGPENVTISGSPQAEGVISSVPTVVRNGWPGNRAALVGDSITYANHHWNPPETSGDVQRYAYYAFLENGYMIWANMLAGNVLELEPALQPNTNPTGSSPNNGYDFGVYSSSTSQWNMSSFDPIPNDTLNNGGPFTNIGPMLMATTYLAGFDIVILLGGTNDISGGATAAQVLTNLKTDAYALAQAGKYVFICVISPCTADHLQSTVGGQGYDQAGCAAAMQRILDVNAGLRTTFGNNAVANIFLVDWWDALVGPTASLIPGVPTDPAGMLSPSSGIVVGSILPATVGTNYRTDAPLAKFFYDGLHPASAGAYAMGKVLLAALKAAGMPSAVAGKLGPLTIGANLCKNTAMTVSTTARSAGAPLVNGRAIGLGAPAGTVSGTGTHDAYTNYGAGFAYGVLPDYFFFYRESNTDQESYSNFMSYTYSGFLDSVLTPYTGDSTWADGAVTTSIATLNGAPALQITVNIPVTGNKNEGFSLRYWLGEGHHGPWDNYGFETGATPSTIAPPYSPGDQLSGACDIAVSGLGSSVLHTMRLVTNYLSINNNDPATDGAVYSGICMGEGFYPFDNLVNISQHPEDKLLHCRTPVVKAPPQAAGETGVSMQFVLQIAFDCSVRGATATFVIANWQVNKVTGPAL